MPGRPCTAKPERRLISASVPVGGHGHQVRRGMDQPELRVSSGVSPRLLVLTLPHFGDPKGNILRI